MEEALNRAGLVARVARVAVELVPDLLLPQRERQTQVAVVAALMPELALAVLVS